MARLRVAVGGSGNMGRQVMAAVLDAEDMDVVGVLDGLAQSDHVLLSDGSEVPLANTVDALAGFEADALIDFSNAAWTDLLLPHAIEIGVRPIIGTTGLSDEFVERMVAASQQAGVGGVIASNFALGAVMMMHLAAIAAHGPGRLVGLAGGIVEVGLDGVGQWYAGGPFAAPVDQGRVPGLFELVQRGDKVVPSGWGFGDAGFAPHAFVDGDAGDLAADLGGEVYAIVQRGQVLPDALIKFVGDGQDMATIGQEPSVVQGHDHVWQVAGGNGAAVVGAGVLVAEVDQLHRPAGMVVLEGGLPQVPVDLEPGTAADIAGNTDDLLILFFGAAGDE